MHGPWQHVPWDACSPSNAASCFEQVSSLARIAEPEAVPFQNSRHSPASAWAVQSAAAYRG